MVKCHSFVDNWPKISLGEEMAGPYWYFGGHTGMAPTIPVAKNYQTSWFEPVRPPPYMYGGGYTGSKV